jgi:hypothetical protein
VREKAGHESKRATPYEAKIVRMQDYRVIATDAGTLRLAPQWQQADLLFKSMGGDQNSYFKAEEVLSTDSLPRVRQHRRQALRHLLLHRTGRENSVAGPANTRGYGSAALSP